MNSRARKRTGCLGLILLVVAGSTAAYEVGTHQKLTAFAFQRSVLANLHEGPLAELGVADLNDVYASSEWDGPSRQATPQDLVGLGARFEDFPVSKAAAVSTPTSQWRFLRHFFNVQNGGTGLEYGGLGPAHSSPAWVLEDVAEIPEQEFSLRDAQQFYYNALGSATQEFRNRNLVLLLEAMGRGTHHLQDMAQPAHSRGDAHPPWPLEDDLYESWTEALYGGGAPLPANLIYGANSVDLRQFDTARKFWTNQNKGIAEFTSRNFVSKDTNFRVHLSGNLSSDPRHPLPMAPSAAQIERKTLTELGITGPSGVPVGQLWFLGTQVVDSYEPATSGFNQRASTLSVLSADLQQYQGMFPVTTLNRLNFESNHQWLLPRAIAYSAGLIDYFFRGKLALVSYNVLGTTATVTIKNVSAAQLALSDNPTPGTEEFSLFYDANDEQRRRLPLVNDELGNTSIARDATRTFTFPLPADVSKNKSRPFTLVFNGSIGQETGITALAFGPPGSAFLVQPNFLPADGIAGPRLIRWNGSRWELTQEVGKVAGNVDWRGHGAADVLTWDGPRSRYFYTTAQRRGISPNIYFDGALLTMAPANVLGAALRHQDETTRELIAAVYNNGQFEIYIRPFQVSYANDNLYDATTNPQGWRIVHSTTQALPASPMFFNASATEAQMFADGLKSRIRVRLGTDGVILESSNARGAGDIRARIRYSGHTTWVPDGQTQCWTESVSRNTTLRTHVWENPTSVCADYRGDEEIICYSDYETDADGSGETIRTNTNKNVALGVGTSSSSNSNKSSDARLLRVGALKLTLGGTISLNEWESTQLEDQRNHHNNYTTGQSLLLKTTRTVMIPYMDIRHELVAYSVTDGKEHIEDSYAGAPSRVEATTKRLETLDSQFVIASPTEARQIARLVTNGPMQVQTRVGTNSDLLYSCGSGTIGANWEDITNTPFTDSSRFDGVIASSVNQGYVFFKDGRFAASQQVRGATSSLPQGIWNFLSDGDFSALFIGAPANAAYYPVQLIR